MSRISSSTTRAELEKSAFRIATLYVIDLATTVKITDYGQQIVDATLGTFTPSGHILEGIEVKESSAIRSNKITFTMSGVEQSFISAMMNYNNINKSFTVYRATIDANASIIGAPFMVYSGIIVGYQVADTETTSAIALDVASHWTDFERTAGRKTNSASQNRYFPDDLGMAFSSTTKQDVKWGRK